MVAGVCMRFIELSNGEIMKILVCNAKVGGKEHKKWDLESGPSELKI